MNLLVDGIGQTARGHRRARKLDVERPRRTAAANQLVGVGEHDRFAAGGADDGAADGTRRVLQVDADGMGKLAGLSANLVIAPARGARQTRNLDSAEQFAAGEIGFEHAGHKSFNRDTALLLRTMNNGRGAERRKGGNPIRRGVGMDQTAADRPAIAHGAIGNSGSHRTQRAAGDIGDAAILDIGMRDATAEGDGLRRFLDTLELGDGREVDKQIGLDQPQVQHRTERLAARNKFHDGIVATAERNCRREIGRTRIIESNRLHGALRAVRAIASSI